MESPDELHRRLRQTGPWCQESIQCGHLLQYSNLLQAPVGKGLLLLSQLVVAEKLADNAFAETLLQNMLAYGVTYKQTFRPVFVVADDGTQLARTLDAMGFQYTKARDPLAAIATPVVIAVIAASPANLKVLADNLNKVEQFTRAGGFIQLQRPDARRNRGLQQDRRLRAHDPAFQA